MAIQFLRGTTAANDAYTGPVGSLTIDTSLGNIRLHDGTTAGGWVIANVDNTGNINSISGTSPIIISGTTSDPIIEIRQATTTQSGYMSSQDKVDLNTVLGWGDHGTVGYELQSNKGVANGYAGLDGSGKVPSIQLPSFVDDVLEFSSQANFPATGETGKIYVAIDTGKTYRWSGSAYTEISSGAVDSVNGQTGVVSLTTTDITEGTNLYFTNARAQGAISVSGDLTYSNGVISFNETYSTASEIKTAYESNPDTNAYTDSEKTKLAGVASGADNYSSWTISDGINSDSITSGSSLIVADSGATSAIYNPVTNTLTISSTDTDTTYTAGTGITLSGTTFSLSGETYTTIEKNKLAGIEAGAEVNAVDSVNGQTGAVVIPNADATTAGLVSTGAQTFGGNKTFSGVVTIDEGTL